MNEILQRVVPVLGLLVMMGICLLWSSNWKLALQRWHLIAWGLGLQFVFAFLVLKTSVGATAMAKFNDGFVAVVNTASVGAETVFGAVYAGGLGSDFATTAYVDAAVTQGVEVAAKEPGKGFYIIAFMLLPTIIFFSALSSILYHLGALQMVVKGMAWLMQRTMGTSGAETLSCSANIFVGQTEAPLIVKPYLKNMTRSELMAVMVGGFATVAGGVMAAYVGMLADKVPNIAGHLLAASIMSAPAALMFAKIMEPETGEPETLGTLKLTEEKTTANVLDAAAVGTTDGVALALNVGAMLIVFLSIVAMLEMFFRQGVLLFTSEPPPWCTLSGLVGFLFAPQAWLMGVTDWNEALVVGRLLGTKMVANEFVAYLDLANTEGLSERARILAVYGLCGFANLGSMGIQIGGLSVMAPSRRQDLSRLAFRAMWAGTFASNATAAVAAIIL